VQMILVKNLKKKFERGDFLLNLSNFERLEGDMGWLEWSGVFFWVNFRRFWLNDGRFGWSNVLFLRNFWLLGWDMGLFGWSGVFF
jgi:hypothetical protein